MTHQPRTRTFRLTTMALAVLTAAGNAWAQDAKPAAEPEKSPIDQRTVIGAGVGLQTGNSADRAFWGQYNGQRNADYFGILDFDFSRRDASTGTWLDIIGSNLGLQTRDIGLSWTRQGDWGLNAAFSELWAVNPYTVNTAVQGTGTTSPTALYLPGGPGTGGDTELSTRRKGLLLGGSKWFGSLFQLEGNVTSENKKGAQLFGVGNNCLSTPAAGCTFTPGTTAGWGVLYMPLPIDYNHTQVEARMNYAGPSLQLSGGYYGSFFSNDNGALNPGFPIIMNNAVGTPLPAGPGVQAFLGQPVAAAPDSGFNYFDLTGNYIFSPIIRANFKLAYSRATQNQSFTSAGLSGAPLGTTGLNASVTNTLAQLRVVANPIPALSIMGEYRYFDSEDNTPVVFYNQAGTTRYTNQTVSKEVNSAKLEATYRFPWQIQGLAGIGWQQIDRGPFTPTASYTGVSALRQTTDETTYFLQVRRSMSETVSGSLTYAYATRDGSNWLAPAIGGVGLVSVSDPTSQLGPNAIYMPTVADRDRSSLRLLLNWAATDALQLQFAIDVGRDSYSAPTQFALQDTDYQLYTLDANYALSEAWSLNGYLSFGNQKLNQARPGGYVLGFEDSTMNAGIGVNGKLGEKWRLGGTLSYINNVDKYAQGLSVPTSPGNTQLLAVTGGLPDITYKRTELRLFGTYAWSERSTLRADAAYQRLTYTDWGYTYGGVPFLYSDNTTVNLQPNQNVGYLGLTYIYTLR
jgi:MtrB/PioB family decaheme-associated outer membrane protein